MVSNTMDFSPAFDSSVKLLLQLHHEMSMGDPDGEQADCIRDEMERPWYEMSENERTLIRRLSADLYSIGQTWTVGSEVRNDLVVLALDALKNLRPEELLDILHANERALPQDSVAFLRGMAWSLFGQYEAAIEFFQEATRISNFQWPPFIHGLFSALIASGRTEQAFAVAEDIAQQSVDPLVVLDVAEVYFVRSTEVDHAQSNELLRKAVETATRGLTLAEQSPQNESLLNQRALIQLWLALFHAGSGDIEAAGRAIGVAHSLMPNNPNVLFVKEIVNQRSKRESWDKGAGRVMVRLRNMPTSVSQLVPDVLVTQ